MKPYDPVVIEKKWQKKWASSKIYRTQEEGSRKQGGGKGKFYVLDMFPYPSGEGLHVGHPKGYIATDVVSRMKRMQGQSVLHPMGFDAFGLPAENYAIKTKTNPADAVKKNVARYKKQLELLGFDYDWSREINTTDPAYYKWTQWIFLQLFKKGLAYESFEPINWCPSCKTGLANEDVEDGRCERCGTPVEKKPLRQWVLKITDYADRLLKDLDAQVLPNSDLYGTAENGDPYVVHMNEAGPGKVRQDKPFVERQAISAFVEHWSEDKFIVLKWKKVDWMTPITGGIEKGQTAEEAARAEILQETGFKNVELVKMADKRMHSTFFHPPKGENRVGHFACFHFKLKDGERQELGAGESDIHEMTWVERAKVRETLTAQAQKIAWALVTSEPIGEGAKPLLDWPESIKEAQRNWIGRSEGAEIDFRLVLKNQKPRFVILHGFEGSAKTNFIPWLKKELEARGHEVEAPELPNTDHPKESEQVEYVLKNCKLDENTVIVAHSLGAVVAMKALMKLGKPISGLLIVAAAVDPRFDAHYESRPFSKDFNWDFDFDAIKKLTSGRIAVLSDTRETFRAPYLKYLAAELSAKLIETDAKEEHFCADKEPVILEAVTPSVKVFTTRPDTIFGATYVVLAPEHHWVEGFLDLIENRSEVEAYVDRSRSETDIQRTDASKEKTGVELKGLKAINPANNEEIPVWIADYVLADYGTGAIMAVPAHDERDFEFAKKFGLPIREVVAEETGAPVADEERRDGIATVIFDPKTQKYAVLEWKLNGLYGLLSGGKDRGESDSETLHREVAEESGFHDFKLVECTGYSYAHYYNGPKKVHRVALVSGYLIILNSTDTTQTKREEHEKFNVKWVSAADIVENWKEHDSIGLGHWKMFLQRGVARAIELGYDKTSDSKIFIYTATTGKGRLINSDRFTGRDSESAKKEITASAGGRWVTRYKLRDWVFSRQRYWGEPIPLIHCGKCGVVPVLEKDLPVKLPKVKFYEPTGTGESPLAAIDKWVNVKCPHCGGTGKRETNTMPQWAGSSWYYLRFEDPKDKKALVDPKKERYWLPVDLYVGGAEHATRHLIYARFWHKFLYDIGAVSGIEPFIKLQSVGLIMGEDGRKMSKRFGNVVNPDEVVNIFGADALRLYEMFMGPFDQSIAWATGGIIGLRRFIERVWKLRLKIGETIPTQLDKAILDRALGKAIIKVTEDIQLLRFNTAVSTLMITLNEMEKPETVLTSYYEDFLKLLAPFAPHVVEDLWYQLGHRESIHVSIWPEEYSLERLNEEHKTIILQINGKRRGSFIVPIAAGKDELEKLARSAPEAQKWLEGKKIERVIAIPGKVVNIVAI